MVKKSRQAHHLRESLHIPVSAEPYSKSVLKRGESVKLNGPRLNKPRRMLAPDGLNHDAGMWSAIGDRYVAVVAVGK